MQKPKLLFIITPPFSGSTALAKVLNSSPNSMMLTHKAEGQWLIPSLCGDDRWNPEKYVDWDLVLSTWYKRHQVVDELVSNIDVIIEKSPPNMVRLAKLLEVFPRSACFAFIRDPYASCSSHFFRRYSPAYLTAEERKRILGQLTNEWIARSGYIMNAIESMGLLHFTYEQFCEDVAECVGAVLKLCPELVTVDNSSLVKVKDYPVQGIINQNSRQTDLLMCEDVECISKTLVRNRSIVSYFGYEIM